MYFSIHSNIILLFGVTAINAGFNFLELWDVMYGIYGTPDIIVENVVSFSKKSSIDSKNII